MGFYDLLEHFSLIWRRHYYRYRATKFDLYPALMAIKQEMCLFEIYQTFCCYMNIYYFGFITFWWKYKCNKPFSSITLDLLFLITGHIVNFFFSSRKVMNIKYIFRTFSNLMQVPFFNYSFVSWKVFCYLNKIVYVFQKEKKAIMPLIASTRTRHTSTEPIRFSSSFGRLM